MNSSAQFLNPAQAARRLGVSVKALRLYEARGLIAPVRTAAGWRAYGPDEMARVGEIAALRELGLSLAQVARVLEGDSESLEPALATHQAALEGRVHQLAGAVDKVRRLRADLSGGRALAPSELARLLRPASDFSVAFDLAFAPWPWGGERFELQDIRSLNYIIGPLGSGKTQLAKRIAETLPGAAFLGLDRLADCGASARAHLARDPALKARVDRTLAWLVEDGATISEALVCLLAGLEMEGPTVLVIDMLEQGLDKATQEALIARLRRRGSDFHRSSFSHDPVRFWIWTPWGTTNRSSFVLPITAPRPVSVRILDSPVSKPSRPVLHHLKCVQGQRASSRGDLKWLDGIDLARRPGGFG